MNTSTLIEAHVDSDVNDEASSVLAAMGLTVSDAIRLLLIKVAQDHKLPFDHLLPNAETIAAMEEARLGQLQSSDSIEQVLLSLKQ